MLYFLTPKFVIYHRDRFLRAYMRMHRTVYMSALILQSLLLFEMFASLLLRSLLVGYVAVNWTLTSSVRNRSLFSILFKDSIFSNLYFANILLLKDMWCMVMIISALNYPCALLESPYIFLIGKFFFHSLFPLGLECGPSLCIPQSLTIELCLNGY